MNACIPRFKTTTTTTTTTNHPTNKKNAWPFQIDERWLFRLLWFSCWLLHPQIYITRTLQCHRLGISGRSASLTIRGCAHLSFSASKLPSLQIKGPPFFRQWSTVRDSTVKIEQPHRGINAIILSSQNFLYVSELNGGLIMISVSSDAYGTTSTSTTLTNCKQAELWTLSGVKNLYHVDDKESEESGLLFFVIFFSQREILWRLSLILSRTGSGRNGKLCPPITF